MTASKTKNDKDKLIVWALYSYLESKGALSKSELLSFAEKWSKTHKISSQEYDATLDFFIASVGYSKHKGQVQSDQHATHIPKEDKVIRLLKAIGILFFWWIFISIAGMPLELFGIMPGAVGFIVGVVMAYRYYS